MLQVDFQRLPWPSIQPNSVDLQHYTSILLLFCTWISQNPARIEVESKSALFQVNLPQEISWFWHESSPKGLSTE